MVIYYPLLMLPVAILHGQEVVFLQQSECIEHIPCANRAYPIESLWRKIKKDAWHFFNWIWISCNSIFQISKNSDHIRGGGWGGGVLGCQSKWALETCSSILRPVTSEPLWRASCRPVRAKEILYQATLEVWELILIWGLEALGSFQSGRFAYSVWQPKYSSDNSRNDSLMQKLKALDS